MKSIRTCTLALAIFAISPEMWAQQTLTWVGGFDQDYNNEMNWSPSQVPNISTWVEILNGGEAIVTGTAGAKSVNPNPGGDASSGTLRVTGNDTVFYTGGVDLGYEGTGSLIVENGARVLYADDSNIGAQFTLGYNGTGNLIITGAGTSVFGSITIGPNQGTGNVTISNGAKFEGDTYQGFSQYNGQASITGNGTTVHLPSAFQGGGLLIGVRPISPEPGNPGTNPSFTVSSGAVVTQDFGVVQVKGNFNAIEGNAVLNIGAAEGATAVEAGNIVAPGIALSSWDNSRGILNFNHTDTNLVLSAPVEGSGEIRHTGPGTTHLIEQGFSGTRVVTAGTLEVSPSNGSDAPYSPATTSVVSGSGTLLINGNYSPGANPTITVENGGTLGGNGTTPGLLTVEAGGTLQGNLTLLPRVSFDENVAHIMGSVRPGGASAGQLTLQFDMVLSGAEVFLDLNGLASGQYDRLINDGAGLLTLEGLTKLHLNADGGTWNLGDTITVLENWEGFVGNFAEITGTELGDSLAWDTSNLLVNGTLTVVPEPSTIVLLGLGSLALFGFGYRHKRSWEVSLIASDARANRPLQ